MKIDISIKSEEDLAIEDDYSVTSLVKAVTEIFVVSKNDLLGTRRMAYMVTPRHVLYYLAYKNTRHSLPSLARFLDRDHTSIIHGRKKTIARLKDNTAFALKVEKTHLLALAYEEKRQKNLENIREEVAEMVYNIQMEKLSNGL